MTIIGQRLNPVTFCTIDGLDVQMSDQSADSSTIVIPAGLETGLKYLVINGPSGKRAVLGAFIIQQPLHEISNQAQLQPNKCLFVQWYLAVYARGQKRKSLSFKIVGKWYRKTFTSDNQVFQRRTAAVGLDMTVQHFIDGEKQIIKTIITRQFARANYQVTLAIHATKLGFEQNSR